MFRDYVLPFEVVSFLLLAALIGAIVLARKDEEGDVIRLPLVLLFSALLFSAGVYGVLARRNAVMVLMAIELMLNAVNVNLVAFSASLQDVTGQIFALFVIAVAAAEVGHRSGDRDPAVPQPRLDQRRRGGPAQVVGVLAQEVTPRRRRPSTGSCSTRS